MDVKTIKHGRVPEPQKFAIGFKCTCCNCEFYVDESLYEGYTELYKSFYHDAANFELRCTCPECGKYARQVDITDYNEIFGKQTLFEWLRTLFEPALVRYGRIQKILENLDSKTYASTL